MENQPVDTSPLPDQMEVDLQRLVFKEIPFVNLKTIKDELTLYGINYISRTENGNSPVAAFRSDGAGGVSFSVGSSIPMPYGRQTIVDADAGTITTSTGFDRPDFFYFDELQRNILSNELLVGSQISSIIFSSVSVNLEDEDKGPYFITATVVAVGTFLGGGDYVKFGYVVEEGRSTTITADITRSIEATTNGTINIASGVSVPADAVLSGRGATITNAGELAFGGGTVRALTEDATINNSPTGSISNIALFASGGRINNSGEIGNISTAFNSEFSTADRSNIVINNAAEGKIGKIFAISANSRIDVFGLVIENIGFSGRESVINNYGNINGQVEFFNGLMTLENTGVIVATGEDVGVSAVSAANTNPDFLTDDIVVRNSGTISYFDDEAEDTAGVRIIGQRARIENSGAIANFNAEGAGVWVIGDDAVVRNENGGEISGVGFAAGAVVVEGERADVRNAGDAFAVSSAALVVGVEGDGARIGNTGQVTSAGNFSGGLGAFGAGFVVTNAGDVLMRSNTSAGLLGVTARIERPIDDRDAVEITPTSVGRLVNAGEIVTEQLEGFGMLGVGRDVVLINEEGAAIRTSGSEAYGMSLGLTPFYTRPSGDSDFAAALAYSVDQTVSGSMINRGIIEVGGENTAGMYASGFDAAELTNFGALVANGAASGRGVLAFGDGLTFTNAVGAFISANTQNGRGVSVAGANAEIVNETGASIDAVGAGGIGIRAENTDGLGAIDRDDVVVRNLGRIDGASAAIFGVGGGVSAYNGPGAIDLLAPGVADPGATLTGGDPELGAGVVLLGDDVGVRNAGLITGARYGVILEGLSSPILNNVNGADILAVGDRGEDGALITGAFATVVNAGRIEGAQTALRLEGSDNSEITNYDFIQGGAVGVRLVGADARLANVAARDGQSSAASPQIIARSAQDALAQTIGASFAGDGGRLVNEGTISAQGVGVEVEGDDFTLLNGSSADAGRGLDAVIRVDVPDSASAADRDARSAFTHVGAGLTLENAGLLYSPGVGVRVHATGGDVVFVNHGAAGVFGHEGPAVLIEGVEGAEPFTVDISNARGALLSGGGGVVIDGAHGVKISSDGAIDSGVDPDESDAVRPAGDGAPGLYLRDIASDAPIDVMLSGGVNVVGDGAWGVLIDGGRLTEGAAPSRKIVIEPSIDAPDGIAVVGDRATGLEILADGVDLETTASVVADSVGGGHAIAVSLGGDDLFWRNAAQARAFGENAVGLRLSGDRASLYNGNGVVGLTDLIDLVQNGRDEPETFIVQQFVFDFSTLDRPIIPLAGIIAEGSGSIGALVTGTNSVLVNFVQDDPEGGVNPGLISGEIGVDLSQGGNTIYNEGLIRGSALAIRGSEGRDVVVNRFAIEGASDLGGGDDVHIHFAGAMTGLVDGGAGNGDQLFISTFKPGPMTEDVPVETVDGAYFKNFERIKVDAADPIVLTGVFDVDSFTVAGVAQLADVEIRGSEITAVGGGVLQVLAGSEVLASGFVGELKTSDGSVLKIGASPGRLSIEGDAIVEGLIELEIGGSRSGQFDELVVGGTADLSNALIEIVFVDGYVPASGSPFELIAAEQIIPPDPSRISVRGLPEDAGVEASFDFTNGGGGQTITITVNEAPANLAPSLSTTSFQGVEDQALAGQLVASDPEDDPIVFSLVPNGGPASGSLDLEADGSFVYTPDPDFFGADSFDVLLDDGENEVQASVSITLADAPEPRPPFRVFLAERLSELDDVGFAGFLRTFLKAVAEYRASGASPQAGSIEPIGESVFWAARDPDEFDFDRVRRPSEDLHVTLASFNEEEDRDEYAPYQDRPDATVDAIGAAELSLLPAPEFF